MKKRHYRADVDLSIIGFGGMTLVGMPQERCDRIVSDSLELGVDYFDVAPFYGDGEAERKLGNSLAPYRDGIFLACKTLCRDAEGARRELERSLRRLRTERFDLYQFHSVSRMPDVDEIFAPGGAAETFVRAREEGKVRFLGFSSHSVPAALAMLDRFEFDSILFPVNFVCYARSGFGRQVLKKAEEKGVARLALKAMALRPWFSGEGKVYPNCWYRPVDDPERALEALRFTLSENVTAAVPPGDERLFRMALELSSRVTVMTEEERRGLLDSAARIRPIFKV